MRFATDDKTPVSALMTKDRLVTVREGVSQEEAKRLLHQHRIEKLLVVDDAYRCIGLITVKDIEKANKFPDASKDEKGRLRVAAATGVGEDGFVRAQAADRRRRRRHRGRHRARPFARRARRGDAGEEAQQLHPGHGRQRRHRARAPRR